MDYFPDDAWSQWLPEARRQIQLREYGDVWYSTPADSYYSKINIPAWDSNFIIEVLFNGDF